MSETGRPRPPGELFDLEAGEIFLPAPEVTEWARAAFIAEAGRLHNPEHQHLADASLGVLWTNVANAKHGRAVLGQCELGDPMAMGKWAKARARQQVTEWFGHIPDFIITLDAAYCEQCSDIEFCALVEHELLHAGQEHDAFGAPKFSAATGRPVFGIRGHDVQEFTSIVRRYGADAAHVREFVEAATQPPEIGIAAISHVCGNCAA